MHFYLSLSLSGCVFIVCVCVCVFDWLGALPGRTSARTLMKMDIEGAEYAVLPHLLRRQHLCSSSIQVVLCVCACVCVRERECVCVCACV